MIGRGSSTELDEMISQQLITLGDHTLSKVAKEMEKLDDMMTISLRLANRNKNQARLCYPLTFLCNLAVVQYLHGYTLKGRKKNSLTAYHTQMTQDFPLKEDQYKARCLEGTHVNTLNRIHAGSEGSTGKGVLGLQEWPGEAN
ncbi:hypothetical protein BJX68DRAFT_226227 [Aspergillus pseudodeflectus]|uniref:Uncharacterized protein n=1 Tax=Aspergillus pseudodeflectus TaxID=176178 RepID=A0ABR4L4D0_9EURO